MVGIFVWRPPQPSKGGIVEFENLNSVIEFMNKKNEILQESNNSATVKSPLRGVGGLAKY